MEGSRSSERKDTGRVICKMTWRIPCSKDGERCVYPITQKGRGDCVKKRPLKTRDLCKRRCCKSNEWTWVCKEQLILQRQLWTHKTTHHEIYSRIIEIHNFKKGLPHSITVKIERKEKRETRKRSIRSEIYKKRQIITWEYKRNSETEMLKPTNVLIILHDPAECLSPLQI